MFGGGSSNPYDDIVVKTTDENLTSENWELILNLCDKVQDDGEEGARNVIAALLKRLTHRNPNVQLFALAAAEALSKNVGITIDREIASRAFTQGLEKLITDRNTHEKVRQKTLVMIATWTNEFEKDSTLDLMEECYNNLKAKNYKFEGPKEIVPPTVDDEIRRKEEEELQLVLEMSMKDKGGRDNWASSYSSNGAGGSSSAAGSSHNAHPTSSSTAIPQPRYDAGYAPASHQRTPSPQIQESYAPQLPQPQPSPPQEASPSMHNGIVTRVKALHTFEPTEPGELGFDKGDVIKVVDRGYKDWWRGQLKGRTGIFPVNYVEALPEPTAAEMAQEAEQEAAVFAQAVNVEKLLNMLRSLDPLKDNLADNEEIQELYRSSMALRPKIVKLIDKYSQKRADLVSMNETFVRARTIFDRMMEESLARHTGVYDQAPRGPYGPQYSRQSSYGDPRNANAPYILNHSQSAPWQNQQSGYLAHGGPLASPPITGPSMSPSYQTPSGSSYGNFPPQQQPAYVSSPGYPQQNQQMHVPGHQQNEHSQFQQPYTVQGPNPYPVQPQQGQSLPEVPSTQTHTLSQPASQPQSQPQPQPQALHVASEPRPQSPLRQQSADLGPSQEILSANHHQTGDHSQGEAQQPVNAVPPYVFDPNATYADPNVQAWAQYYAKGGKELAGTVYFIEIPGLTTASREVTSVDSSAIQHEHDTDIVDSTEPLPMPDYNQEPGRGMTSVSRSGSLRSDPLPMPQFEEPVPYSQNEKIDQGTGSNPVSNTAMKLGTAASVPAWVLPKVGPA